MSKRDKGQRPSNKSQQLSSVLSEAIKPKRGRLPKKDPPAKKPKADKAGSTFIPGKAPSVDHSTQSLASVVQALERIEAAFETQAKAQLRQREVNGSCTEALNAAEDAFKAVMELQEDRATASKLISKLDRCETSWRELQEVRATCKAKRHKARAAVEAAEKQLADEIAHSRQGELDLDTDS